MGNISPLIWNLIPQAVDPIAKVIHMEKSSTLLTYIDTRVLISMDPGIDLHKNIYFMMQVTYLCNVMNEFYHLFYDASDKFVQCNEVYHLFYDDSDKTYNCKIH